MTSKRGKNVDLSDSLGADGGTSVQCFSIYIPEKDMNGKTIGGQRKWVQEALQLLGKINGGATAMPPCEGTWQNDKGDIITEHPVVVYSHIKPEAFMANLQQIREFLHRLGRETKQGEIAFEFEQKFYRIQKFDKE